MDFTQYISAELSVLIPILCGIGVWLKNNDRIKNKYIPVILTGISVFLCVVYTLSQSVTLEGLCTGIVQGVFVAAASVYSNQMYKQAKTEE